MFVSRFRVISLFMHKVYCPMPGNATADGLTSKSKYPKRTSLKQASKYVPNPRLQLIKCTLALR